MVRAWTNPPVLYWWKSGYRSSLARSSWIRSSIHGASWPQCVVLKYVFFLFDLFPCVTAGPYTWCLYPYDAFYRYLLAIYVFAQSEFNIPCACGCVYIYTECALYVDSYHLLGMCTVWWTDWTLPKSIFLYVPKSNWKFQFGIRYVFIVNFGNPILFRY